MAAFLPSFDLDGRLIIVTGASGGIGRSFAESYAAAGAHVILASRNREKLNDVRQSIEAAGGDAGVAQLDISHVEQVRAFADDLERRLAGDAETKLVLVNNAGLRHTKPALDVTEEEWDAMMDTHLKGTFFCCQQIGRLMVDRGYGKIINLSSTWAVRSDIGKSVYGTAKAGISHLTANLSAEWAPLGVRVNAIAPTATRTGSVAASMEKDPERFRRLVERIKLGRLAETGDLVGTAVFLAGEASDFITGQTLFVDGGFSAS